MTDWRYVAVEGPIGVGKTTLARRLAETWSADLLLEAPEENPFLGAFYDQPTANALSAQLFFLLQRARQTETLRQRDLFHQRRITDFMFEKDPLFARLTLSGPEWTLYEDIYTRLAWQAPAPDKLIYLYAPRDTLMARVRQRARPEERNLDLDYLARVIESYAAYFSHYQDAPLVTVNAEQMDLVGNDDDYQRLLAALDSPARRVDLPGPASAMTNGPEVL